MYTDRILKSKRFELILNIILGTGLLIVGIIFRIMNIRLVENNKALIGLSFIPFAIAVDKLIFIRNVNKHPKSMTAVLIAENDERLIMQRNEAEAISNRIFRWIIYLVFIGYSLVFPSEAFEATGWWIVLFLFLASYLLPCFFQHRLNSNYRIEDK
jgi:hypothetical protein